MVEHSMLFLHDILHYKVGDCIIIGNTWRERTKTNNASIGLPQPSDFSVSGTRAGAR